jgi:hypothetical protein
MIDFLQSPQSELSSPEVAKLLAAIWALVALLPVADQQRLADDIVKTMRAIPGFRSGDVLSSVVRFLPKCPQWSAEEIRKDGQRFGRELRRHRVEI